MPLYLPDEQITLPAKAIVFDLGARPALETGTKLARDQRAVPTRPAAAVRAKLSPEAYPASAAGSKAKTAEGVPLSSEIALVQQATRALAAGEAGVALDILDTCERQCPRGVLRPEAGVLRVQALMRRGNTSEARQLARQLLDANLVGVFAARLQAATGGDTEERPIW